jgi:hypothetical protein
VEWENSCYYIILGKKCFRSSKFLDLSLDKIGLWKLTFVPTFRAKENFEYFIHLHRHQMGVEMCCCALSFCRQSKFTIVPVIKFKVWMANSSFTFQLKSCLTQNSETADVSSHLVPQGACNLMTNQHIRRLCLLCHI